VEVAEPSEEEAPEEPDGTGADGGPDDEAGGAGGPGTQGGVHHQPSGAASGSGDAPGRPETSADDE
jgi:hypothetical protein